MRQSICSLAGGLLFAVIAMGAAAQTPAPAGQSVIAVQRSTLPVFRKLLPEPVAVLVGADEIGGVATGNEASFKVASASGVTSLVEESGDAAGLLGGLARSYQSHERFRTGITLVTIRGDRTRRSIKAVIRRLYTGLPGNIEQLFRERVSFVQPSVLVGFEWLTFRFNTSEDDVVWVRSPAIKRVRQMVSTVRGDAMLPDAPTLDDIYVWSGKAEGREVQTAVKTKLLVPFLDLKAEASDDTHCQGLQAIEVVEEKKVERKPTPVAPWLFLLKFVVRDVIRVEVAVKDPFYAGGTEELVFDATTGLPIYKVVRELDGAVRRVALGALSQTSAHGKARVFNAAWLVRDMLERDLTAVAATSWEWCASSAPDFEVGRFDPSALADAASVPAPVQGATATEIPGVADDAEASGR